MSQLVRIELLPIQKVFSVPIGTPLLQVLGQVGFEFPCGGKGICRGCRIRVLEGHLEPSKADLERFSPEELAQGWRLACQARVMGPLTLEVAQWETPVLIDETAPMTLTPQEGIGIAVDVGTTTIAVQSLDLRSGHVLGVQTALNAQARYGSDLMSRIEAAVMQGKQEELTQILRDQIGTLCQKSLPEGESTPPEAVRRIVLVGNTVMHHFFSGLPLNGLAVAPFQPADPGPQRFSGQQLGWRFAPDAEVLFLPCLGGFVGSDLLAGLLALHLHETPRPAVLIDLGTNGEIVIHTGDQIFCASTAAGPAFEGGRISMGMRAAPGAIVSVEIQNGQLVAEVLGGETPRGICGSGLVDAVACGLRLGWIEPSGRLRIGSEMPVADPVVLTQGDIRQLQLAKGAIAAGLDILLKEATLETVPPIYLAGAFGNYIKVSSAQAIGLFPHKIHSITPIGNSALLGAKIFLLSSLPSALPSALFGQLHHVPLGEHPQFQEIFLKNLSFDHTRNVLHEASHSTDPQNGRS